MSYSSDVKPEQEASWVGYGWQLDAPTISRVRRGFPDDASEQEVSFLSKGEMTTYSVSLFGSPEILSTNYGALSGSLTYTWNTLTNNSDFFFTPSVSVMLGLSGLMFGSALSYDTKGRYSIAATIGISQPLRGSLGFSNSIYSYSPGGNQAPTVGLRPAFSGSIFSGQGSARFSGNEVGANVTVSQYQLKNQTSKVNGYLHSMETVGETSRRDQMIDYIVDRERAITEETADPLPVPLPGYDEFVVSAAGTSGRFRAHLPLPMYARPPESKYEISIASISAKYIFPDPLPPVEDPPPPPSTGGGGVGTLIPPIATMTTSSGGIRAFEYSDIVNESKKWSAMMRPFFRFVGDPIDPVRYSTSYGKAKDINLSAFTKNEYVPVGYGRKPRMAKSIEYRTVAEVSELLPLINDADVVSELKATRFGNISTQQSAYRHLSPDLICEFSITDETGRTTIFGAPEYSLEEKQLSLVAKGQTGNRTENRIHYRDTELHINNVVSGGGQEQQFSYATAWKATAICGPNYVDLDGNGPDEGDVGGWTKFNYVPDRARNWRVPFAGYWLDKADISTADDDILTYSTGKHQGQVLRSIETETHIAIFFTDTKPTADVALGEYPSAGSPTVATYATRRDAAQPPRGDASAHVPDGMPDRGDGSIEHRPYLARIELWVKDADGLPKTKLQTVHFSYDYSAFPGNPSSVAPEGEDHLGKLTLRRVWSEDRSVKDATIEPVDFYYRYPNYTSTPTTYADILDVDAGVLSTRYPGSLTAPASTNDSPVFDANKIDAWGYMGDLEIDKIPQANGVSVSRYSPSPSYVPQTIDPASWRLKAIRTPAGGIVAPIYEPRTYGAVQNKVPMEMTPLFSDPQVVVSADLTTTANSSLNRYVIDLTALGMDAANVSARERYVAGFIARFVEGEEKISYRFAYDTYKCGGQNLETRFVEGHAKVTSVIVNGTDPTKLEIRLGDMDGPNGDLNTRFAAGQLSLTEMENELEDAPYWGAIKLWLTLLRNRCLGNPSDPMDLVTTAFANKSSWRTSSDYDIPTAELPVLNAQLSELRVPSVVSKTGDGVRVKRLLLISPDGALETDGGDVEAVGTEYIYGAIDANGIETQSYGVTANEPYMLRQESILRATGNRGSQQSALSVVDPLIAGTEEGPLVSSLLPSAGVGYSRVITRSINTSGNSSGFRVLNFFTTLDQPSLTVTRSTAEVSPDPFTEQHLPMFSYSKLDLTATQTFTIHLYDVFGLPKSTEHYTGTPEQPGSLVTSTSYEYLEPGKSLLKYFDDAASLRYVKKFDAEDIIAESRDVVEEYAYGRLDVTAEGYSGIPIPVVGLGGSYSMAHHRVRTATSAYIVRFTPTLLRTVHYDRGQRNDIEVLAYHDETGGPAIVVGKDEFDETVNDNEKFSGSEVANVGTISTVSIPALSRYPDLGRRADSYRMVFGHATKGEMTPVVGTTMVTVEAPVNGQQVLSVTRASVNAAIDPDRNDLLRSYFHEGDLLTITQANGGDLDFKAVVRVRDVPYQASSSLEAILYCEVEYGSLPSQGQQAGIEIMQSGAYNALMANAESSVLYGEDYTDRIARAHALEDQEYWIEWLNHAARIKWGGLLFEQFATPSDPPFIIDKGSLSFIPTQTHVQTLDNVAWCSCSPFPYNASSVYRYNIHYDEGSGYLRAGITNYAGMVGNFQSLASPPSCSDCGPNTLSSVNCEYPWANQTMPVPCYLYAWQILDVTSTGQPPVLTPDPMISGNWPDKFAVHEYTWDSWMLFYGSDLGSLVAGSVRPQPTATNTGSFEFKYGQQASVTEAVDATSRYLSKTLHPWQRWQKTVSGRDYSIWTPATVWQWQTDQTTDASQIEQVSAGNEQTVFRHAGTFAKPGSIDESVWTDPQGTTQDAAPALTSLQRQGWYRGPLLSQVNTHGETEVVVDARDRASVVQYAGNGFYPVARFTHAEPGSSWYEDFEEETGSSAFTGHGALLVQGTSPSTIEQPAEAIAASTSTTAIIRAWIRPVVQTDNLVGNLSIESQQLAAEDVLAAIDGWFLVEVKRNSVIPDAIEVQKSASLGDILIDDLVVTQVLTSSATTVRDDEHRTIAMFDSQHFPIRHSYDPRGRIAITTAESSSGEAALTATSFVVPGRLRTSAYVQGGALVESDPLSLPMINVDGLMRKGRGMLDEILHKAAESVPSGVGAKENLLDVNIDSKGVKVDSPVKSGVQEILKKKEEPTDSTPTTPDVNAEERPSPDETDKQKGGGE